MSHLPPNEASPLTAERWSFMALHLTKPIPSPAVMEKIGTKFRPAVRAFAEANDVPLIKFAKRDRKGEVMGPYLQAQAKIGAAAVVSIGCPGVLQGSRG